MSECARAMGKDQSPLNSFHPLVAKWFTESTGAPTDLQVLAWPQIAAEQHVLIAAPTGSGKTLAAFLWAINALITGKWPPGRTAVLYISPLKALNNDIRRNLVRPLAELKAVFMRAGEPFPSIGVAVRSGDTPQAERRRMLRNPPEILITTPESFNLLLSSHGGRSILGDIRTVILDEIHAVAGSKRGVHLITGVDRLVPLSGEFQRIALSATVRPLETVARFVGGYRMTGDPVNPQFSPRPVRIVSSSRRKEYGLSIRSPVTEPEWNEVDSFWRPFVSGIKDAVMRNRSTLIFVNSRRLCEKLTHMLNENEPEAVAYAHHGSLSREIRTAVERKLKAGELRAIVATNSLELGIDIGALDEVILLQAPLSISSAIQRIGRAGHRVGDVSRGILFPTDPRDIVHMAVLAGGILEQDVEEIHPVPAPLDVLAQVIISMTGIEAWNLDALYALLRTSYPYHSLTRRQFDLVIEMLAGRYAGTRIRELKPRIAVDRLDNTATARQGALQAIYSSGGTIPDRGYFHLRLRENGARIGDLDEEFVWEAKTGQVFTFGTQNWKIERVTHNDVFVTPAHPGAAAPPFWRAEENLRDSHFSMRIADFLEAVEELLADPGVSECIPKDSSMGPSTLERLAEVVRSRSSGRSSSDPLCAFTILDPGSMERLIGFLARQREATGRPLPHRHHVLVEHVEAGPGGYPGNQVVLHTIWGGRINRPFAMALEAAWEDRFGCRPEIFPGNDCVMLQFPHEAEGEEILSLVTSGNFSGLIRKRLEGSGFFGARFRECAGRALLLPRSRINERMPLWLSRLRSQKLLDSVFGYEDFPILLEAWRTCLKDDLDMEGLAGVLAGLESGVIAWSETRTTRPSPMAESVNWPLINRYMYMDDRPLTDGKSKLRGDLLHEVVSIPELRPSVTREAAAGFELKRRRLAPGYSPDGARDLVEWVKERLLVPQAEWEELIDAMRRDHDLAREALLQAAAERLIRVHPPRAEEPLIVALENFPRLSRSLSWDIDDVAPSMLDSEEKFPASRLRDILSRFDGPAREEPDELFTETLSEWLQFYSPRSPEFVRETLGLDGDRLASAVEALVDAERLVSGRLIANDPQDRICDGENFERILRLSRAAARPAFSALDIRRLQPFLARWQGLVTAESAKGPEGVFKRLEQLVSCPAPAELWETEILPARVKPCDPSWLDTVMQQSDLRWVGMPGERVVFSFEPDLDLLREEGTGEASGESGMVPDNGDTKPPGVDLSGAFQEEKGAKRPRLRLVSAPAKRRGEDTASVSGEHSGPNTGNGCEGNGNDAVLARVFSSPGARYSFAALADLSGIGPGVLADMLWKEVWRGRITNDTFAALRRGIENDFRVADPAARLAGAGRRRRGGRRTAFSMWKGSLPAAGNWMRIEWPGRENDPLEKAERGKERVRQLLDRYGIVFRELLQYELPAFGWRNIFRDLRIMELSGEVLTGYFFEGIPGPQFISREAFRMLQKKFPEDAVYWICATDPASLCGTRLDVLKGKLPRRLPGTHLVYHGGDLVMESRRNGRDLVFHVPENDPCLQDCLGVFHHLLTRRFQPLRRIVVETCGGISMDDLERHLRKRFDVVKDDGKLDVYGKYSSDSVPNRGWE